MPELTDIQRDLLALAADLKRLEAEYTMFFAGRIKRPPWETRGRVEATIKRWGRGQIPGTSDRFRFEMLQIALSGADRFVGSRDAGQGGRAARSVRAAGPENDEAARSRKQPRKTARSCT